MRTVPASLSQQQINDLADLFSEALTPFNLSWLGTAVLGVDVLREEGNSIGRTKELAVRLVERLAEGHAIPAAVALLKRESRNNGYLCLGLDAILAGQRFNPSSLQGLMNTYEPFFNSAAFQRMLPRVRGAVCAVAINHKLRGTGFLIGPDLVLTNFHIFPDGYLKQSTIDSERWEQVGAGKNLGFVFDYQSEPPPNLSSKTPERAGSALIVHAAEAWLVHARRLRDSDGKPYAAMPVNKELDYAVIRLVSKVGLKPSRVSGGAMRGWLPLPTDQCNFLANSRVLVFQHPGGTSQKMDVGEFVQLDPSNTRAWYSVNAAHGSSGGAAVNGNGDLFALHNADVQTPPTGLAKVNQGVRIDMIAQDLATHVQGWTSPRAVEDSTVAVWSLTDSLDNARPIIGRRVFRENVEQMTANPDKRTMVVLGEYGTFARFTVALLQRVVGNQVPIARFTRTDIQTLSPQDFSGSVLEQLGVRRDMEDPMPTPPETETLERWLALDLPNWVGRQLARHAKAQPGIFPAWVVIDVTVGPDEPRVLWTHGLRDLVTALMGVRDAGQFVDIPELRWVVTSTAPLPIGGTTRLEEDLRGDLDIESGFVECMQFAWRAIDTSENLPYTLLAWMVGRAKDENSAKPAEERLPIRKVLAATVVNAITWAPKH